MSETPKLLTRERLVWTFGIAVLLFFFWHYARNEGVKSAQYLNYIQQLEREVNQLRAAGDSARAQANEVAKEREIYVKTATATQSDLKAQVKRWKKLALIRDQSIPIDSMPVSVSDSPCSERDSVIRYQDQLIFSLETQVSTVTASFTKELMLAATQLSAEKQISELLLKNREDQSKQVRKERRGKKFWRSVSVVAITVAGVLFVSQ